MIRSLVVAAACVAGLLVAPSPASAASPLLYLNPAKRIPTQSIAWAGSEWWSAQAEAGSVEGAETLTISRMDGSGRFLSSMRLVDSSHGSQIGVEASPPYRYVWVAWVRGPGDPGLARVRYQGGTTVTVDSPRVSFPAVVNRPGVYSDANVVGGWLVTHNTELATRRQWFERRKVADVVAGVDELYGVVEFPPLGLGGRGGIYQGHTSSGDVIYRVQGMPDSPVTVARWSWTTGESLGVSDISSSLPANREPEGMATSGAGRVFLGVVSGQGATRYPVFEVSGGQVIGRRVTCERSSDRVRRPKAGVRVRVVRGCESARVTVRVRRPEYRHVRVVVDGRRIDRRARWVQSFRVEDGGWVKVRGPGRDARVRFRA